MLGLIECCLWSRAGIFPSGVGWGCENSVANRVSLCLLVGSLVSFVEYHNRLACSILRILRHLVDRLIAVIVLLPPSQRRARSRTGSVSREPSFARGLVEELLAFSPCCPPASRTESTPDVPAPTGRRSCED